MAFFRSRFKIAADPGKPSPLRAALGRRVTARLDADPRFARLPAPAVQAYAARDYLSSDQCDAMVAMIDANRRPSTLFDAEANPGFRTSESCDMARNSPAVEPIDRALADVLGLDPDCGETMQGQRYAPGQHFKPHHDYFHDGGSYWPAMRQRGGQRTWTAMIYLNDVVEGGATWFPQAGLRIAPQRGLLLTWNNMAVDGSPNPATRHEGMPVVAGVKYIITKWFREGSWVKR